MTDTAIRIVCTGGSNRLGGALHEPKPFTTLDLAADGSYAERRYRDGNAPWRGGMLIQGLEDGEPVSDRTTGRAILPARQHHREVNGVVTWLLVCRVCGRRAVLAADEMDREVSAALLRDAPRTIDIANLIPKH
jgi:hypothetical protein